LEGDGGQKYAVLNCIIQFNWCPNLVISTTNSFPARAQPRQSSATSAQLNTKPGNNLPNLWVTKIDDSVRLEPFQKQIYNLSKQIGEAPKFRLPTTTIFRTFPYGTSHSPTTTIFPTRMRPEHCSCPLTLFLLPTQPALQAVTLAVSLCHPKIAC
jgi:hypothetical protein